MSGHHSANPGTVEWLTPPEILAALGPFDLDPCAPAVRPWDMAREHYTEADNGLSRDWSGRVWLNPPYTLALIVEFMRRMAAHDHGTALVMARTETEWWFEHVWPRATAVLFMGPHRIHFHHLDGARAKGNSGAPTALIAYGIEDADRLADSGISGAFIPLAGSGQVVIAFRPQCDVTWARLIEEVAQREGGKLTVAAAYVLIGRHPKAAANQNWKATVRKILQGPKFNRVAPATYELEVA